MREGPSGLVVELTPSGHYQRIEIEDHAAGTKDMGSFEADCANTAPGPPGGPKDERHMFHCPFHRRKYPQTERARRACGRLGGPGGCSAGLDISPTRHGRQREGINGMDIGRAAAVQDDQQEPGCREQPAQMRHCRFKDGCVSQVGTHVGTDQSDSRPVPGLQGGARRGPHGGLLAATEV